MCAENTPNYRKNKNKKMYLKSENDFFPHTHLLLGFRKLFTTSLCDTDKSRIFAINTRPAVDRARRTRPIRGKRKRRVVNGDHCGTTDKRKTK